MKSKYNVGDTLRMFSDNEEMFIDLRVTHVRHFPPRILYSFDVVNQEEAGFPFPRAAYFESELERFGVEQLELVTK